jgi:hypothetical protein
MSAAKIPVSQKGEYYESADAIHKDFRDLAEQCGFGMGSQSSSFQCHGYEEPALNKMRK